MEPPGAQAPLFAERYGVRHAECGRLHFFLKEIWNFKKYPTKTAFCRIRDKVPIGTMTFVESCRLDPLKWVHICRFCMSNPKRHSFKNSTNLKCELSRALARCAKGRLSTRSLGERGPSFLRASGAQGAGAFQNANFDSRSANRTVT